MGTLSLPEYTNLPEDCKNLRTAFKGLGCNEKRVIEILGRRTQAQRMEIAQAYQTVYSQSLHKRLKSAFNGKLEKALLLWMMDAAERDAVLLYEVIRGTGSKCDRALIGILCTRTSAQLFLIKQAYYTMFSETLENHISGVDTCAADFHKTKWAFWRGTDSRKIEFRERLPSITKLLLALVRGNRPENTDIDRHIALNDAHQLNKVCMGRTGSEDTFIHIISTRSTAQLLATLNYFQQHYGQEFEKALKKERWGELEGALQVAVQCFRQPAKFYAEELCVALMGFAMDDDTLIRVITTRAEIDMQYIKLEFTNESKRLLEEVIAIDTSGSYRLFLLTLIGHGEVGLYSPSNTAGSASFFSASSNSQHQSNVSVASSRSSDHN
ncbi:unnamed protein product [Sphagnum jensenii]|uniref:Annexin n=1 Tax=Sphagnum jensenii TaxID=128206 RepID=A0ABP1C1S7_9BRYO